MYLCTDMLNGTRKQKAQKSRVGKVNFVVEMKSFEGKVSLTGDSPCACLCGCITSELRLRALFWTQDLNLSSAWQSTGPAEMSFHLRRQVGPSFLPNLRPMSFSFRPPKKEENSTLDFFFSMQGELNH